MLDDEKLRTELDDGKELELLDDSDDELDDELDELDEDEELELLDDDDDELDDDEDEENDVDGGANPCNEYISFANSTPFGPVRSTKSTSFVTGSIHKPWASILLTTRRPVDKMGRLLAST